jgi:hypothetical protein
MALMRRRTLVAVLISGSLVLAGAGRASAGTPPGCARSGEAVIARSAEVQVVAPRGQDEVYDRVFACLRGRSTRFRLDRPASFESIVGRPVLTGKMVAVAISAPADEGTESALVIADVGHRRRTYAVGLELGADLLPDVELKRNGAVAFIQGQEGGAYEVLICRLDACGGPQGLQPVVADTGAGIEPKSLTRRGSVISWIHDEKRRTATL